MSFVTGIALETLFDIIFTLIKPYLAYIMFWKDQNMPCEFQKELEGKKCQYQ